VNLNTMQHIKIRKYSLLVGLCLFFLLGTISAQSIDPRGVAKVIFFDYGSFVVLPEFENVIRVHAEFLIANPKSKVSIEGHTEDMGGYEYNLSLAQRRAKVVTSFLLKFGVPSIQIESVSFGSTKPAAEGDDEAAIATNRRVEFFYR
jgi:peptidoglycan-associated lipoprotein